MTFSGCCGAAERHIPLAYITSNIAGLMGMQGTNSLIKNDNFINAAMQGML
jgi:hypothetical protein